MESQGEDGTIGRITHAFDAAFRRFEQARSIADLEDETSNLVHHLYRLAVAVHGEPTRGKAGTGWEKLVGQEGPAGLVPPLVLMRHKDVHELVGQAEMRGVYPEVYSHFYGTFVWDIAPFMDDDTRTVRYFVHDKLDGQSVRSTLRDARLALTPELPIDAGQTSS